MTRTDSYGQYGAKGFLEKFGFLLSIKMIKKQFAKLNHNNLVMLDIGCGYNMDITRYFINNCSKVIVMDVAINPNIESHKIVKIIGDIEEELPKITENSVDVIIFNNVLEHLKIPFDALRETYRVLKDAGELLLNVPTWRGKVALEMQAFKFNSGSAKYEMDDHKMYYDKKDVWPILVKAGFLPSRIELSYHKFGFNLFCHCKK